MTLSKKQQCFTIFFLSFLCIFVSFANAQNLQQIKEQMLNRKPTIDALKNKGLVGEGVDGYLHVRQNDNEAAKVVNAENADRRTVNAVIAQKEGTTVEQVSKKVAAKLIEASAPGHWLQKGDGTWYKK